jgi:hypothetical protein
MQLPAAEPPNAQAVLALSGRPSTIGAAKKNFCERDDESSGQ